MGLHSVLLLYEALSCYFQSLVGGACSFFTSQFIKTLSCLHWNIFTKAMVNPLLSMLTGKITASSLVFFISLQFDWGLLFYLRLLISDISVFQRDVLKTEMNNQKKVCILSRVTRKLHFFQYLFCTFSNNWEKMLTNNKYFGRSAAQGAL